jgi:hypothetical protein
MIIVIPPAMALRTIHQLVQDYIYRRAALISDPLHMSQESDRMIARIADRLRQDPAVELYAQHMAKALEASLLAVPHGLHSVCMHSLILQALIEWEDINIAYNKELSPAA